MGKLVPNPVFIDTSVFYQSNFDFTSKQFHQLIELSQRHIIKIILTEINKQEILRHIKILSSEAQDSFRKYIRKNRIIRTSLLDDLVEIEKKFELNSLFDTCKKAFEEWLNKADVEVIPYYYSDSKEVFDMYFNEQSPFKFKKNEFPDAFALSAICRSHKNITVVSSDKDILDFNHTAITSHFSTLNSFIDHILNANHSIHSLIIQEYSKQKDYVIDAIKEGFPNLEFISLKGSYYEPAVVKDISIWEEKIIEIQDNSATVNISATIDYEIAVYYDEEEDYKVEEDDHYTEIEITFDFATSAIANEFEYIKIKSIKPKTTSYDFVFINKEEFERL